MRAHAAGRGVGAISWSYLSQVTPPISPQARPVPPTKPTQSHREPPGWRFGMGGGGHCTVVSPLDAHSAEDDGRADM